MNIFTEVKQQAPSILLWYNDQGGRVILFPFISELPMEECGIWDLGVGLQLILRQVEHLGLLGAHDQLS
jgi:hypothetical protein